MNKLLVYQVSTIVFLYLGYGFYTFTRKSISYMMPHFSNGAHNSTSLMNITKNDIGIIISVQNIAYTFSKFLSGFLSDFLSCRILFGAGLFLSGLLNIGFKKDSDIFALYWLSFQIGFVQGPAWPCCAKLLQNWVPRSQFATWWSILSTSANLAGVLGPIIATSIALNHHWSYGFLIPGCICMSVGYLSIIILRNRPSDVYLVDFDADSPTYKINENVYSKYKEEIEAEAEADNDEEENENELEHYNENEYETEIDSENYIQHNYDEVEQTVNQNEIADENSNNPEDFLNNDQNQFQQEVFENEPNLEATANYDGNDVDEIQNFDCENKNEIKIGRIQRVKMLFSYPFFISICFAYFFVSLIKTIYSDWSQLYLIRNVKVDPYNASYFLSMFELGGIFGSILSGILSDHLYRVSLLKSQKEPSMYKEVNSTQIRMSMVRYFMIGLIISMHLFSIFNAISVSNVFLLMIGFSSGFLSYGCISLLGVIAMEFTPSSFSGSSHAIAAFAAGLGAICAGFPFSFLSLYLGWIGAFKTVEASTVLVIIFLIKFRNSKCKFEIEPVEDLDQRKNQ